LVGGALASTGSRKSRRVRFGRSAGRYAGFRGWTTGLAMVAIGVVLVAITMALGG